MGMSEREFGFMTPRTFFNKLKGFAKIRKENYQAEWERTRWMAWKLIGVSGKVVKGELKLTDVITFSWEKSKKVKANYDKERFEYLVKKFGKQWHSS